MLVGHVKPRASRPFQLALALVAAVTGAGNAIGQELTGGVAKGAEIYQSACKGCHETTIAPDLQGVVGREVASVATFPSYSKALKQKQGSRWTPAELNRFLENPRERIPGTLMMQTVPDAQERKDLIAYLEVHGVKDKSNAATKAIITGPVTVAVRRLNESQYRNTIRDIFGPEIEVKARFEPDRRHEGLLAIGNTDLSMTAAGFEQYFGLARNISAQVLKPDSRNEAVPCTQPKSDKAALSCAEKFIAKFGQSLFRRPLSEAEHTGRLAIVKQHLQNAGDFYQGLELALASLLAAPEFLFRVEIAEPDPAREGELRLDAYTKAARLSYLFWNTSPDAQLVRAAKSGALHTEKGLQKQVERLVASPRYDEGVRAFFTDLMQLDGFDNLVKDSEIYPKFNQLVSSSAREQMLKTVVDRVLTKNGDYRDLFVSNETFINRSLAALYKVPYTSSEPWSPYTFREDSERAGILSQAGYLSLFAHPGTSSPTRRGIKLYEIFMCEMTPDPPADVDFSKVKDSKAGTVRGRLLDHMENTGCVACHRRSDPPGLALEHFDGLGQLRKYENGQLIDVSADLNGVKFTGASGLGDYLYKDERIPACLVRNIYAYSAGRLPDESLAGFLQSSTSDFVSGGYRLPALMKRMATSAEFFSASLPEGVGADETVAINH